MSQQALTSLFERELEKLKKEVLAYDEESSLWVISGEIKNSGGNLCLHICGNLQHYIGCAIGNSGYVRQRDREFSDKNVPVTELITLIDTTKKVVNDTIATLSPEDMKKDYPQEFYRGDMDVEHLLIHVYGHLTYHMGQINYHRRLLNR